MIETNRQKTPNMRVPSDRFVYLGLLALGVLVRIPFLRAFDLVAYDGTHYVREAAWILGRSPAGGVFPIGYPSLIALFLPVVGDGVRAAQIVSFLGGIGAVWLVYALGSRIVSRPLALLAALALSVTPLFIRLSLMTLAESVFVFWVLLGFYFYQRGKNVLFGIAMGMAAITRPEALGIFALLVLVRARPWKGLVRMLAGFVVLFALNAAVLSVTLGRFVPGDTRFALLRRTETVGRTSTSWQGREQWADFAGREEYEQALQGDKGASFFGGALKRYPKDLALLLRHVTPAALALALIGVYAKRLFLLAGLVPFVFLPFLSPRSDPRYMLLYTPILFLYAAVGLERLRPRSVRLSGIALFAVSAAAGVYLNRSELVEPVSDGYQWAKKAGIEWRGRLEAGDSVADRKPFFAFYAGARYVEIPIAPYDDAIGTLAREKVRLLVLHRDTIEPLRPALTPLLFDPAAIRGELRYRQVEIDPSSYVIYEWERSEDPLSRKRITPRVDGMVVTPSWSPDGKSIGFRRIEPSGKWSIWVVPAEGGEMSRLVAPGGSSVIDPLTWSPDSKRIAFAAANKGGLDIRVYDLDHGTLEDVVTGAGNDRSPCWSKDGREIVFSSDRSGSEEIWSVNLATKAFARLTTGGKNTLPALSPVGDRLAWVREGSGLVIMDRTTGSARLMEDVPAKRMSAPSWSPDGDYIAVAAEESGGARVYLVSSRDGKSLVLTKTVAGCGMPSWSPDGKGIVVVTNDGGDFGLWVLSGLEPYEERLLSPTPVETLSRGQ
jgi:hypothetical protein